MESDDEDGELTAAYIAREESDELEDEVDDSEAVVRLTLREARAVGENLKIFVLQNQA